VAFAQRDKAGLLLGPVARLTVTTRQASRSAADCGLADLLMRLRRGVAPIGFLLAAPPSYRGWLGPSSGEIFPRWLIGASHDPFGATCISSFIHQKFPLTVAVNRAASPRVSINLTLLECPFGCCLFAQVGLGVPVALLRYFEVRYAVFFDLSSVCTTATACGL
jgi:hypothetical protein